MKESHVYILASKYNGTLYIGLTSDLIRRVWEHKNKFIPGFTQKYNVTMLVYYEIFNDITLAAAREKRLKEWKRQWKIDLIQKNNPKWKDLYTDIIYRVGGALRSPSSHTTVRAMSHTAVSTKLLTL